MSESDWTPEELRALVELLRGLAEDEAIAGLEVSLARSADATPTPMPDTAHPAYEHDACSIRSLMDGRPAIFVARTLPASAMFARADEPIAPVSATMRPIVLTVKRCAGPAPFVGDPMTNDARYFWEVAIDDAGRWVATSAELVWRFGASA